MYNRTGKIAVKFAFRYLRRRYRRETRIAFGVFGVGIVAAIAYIATREVPEG
jgi:ABC-type lipoprotein release transport system permease subunit